jgi:hypothetical protein
MFKIEMREKLINENLNLPPYNPNSKMKIQNNDVIEKPHIMKLSSTPLPVKSSDCRDIRI